MGYIVAVVYCAYSDILEGFNPWSTHLNPAHGREVVMKDLRFMGYNEQLQLTGARAFVVSVHGDHGVPFT